MLAFLKEIFDLKGIDWRLWLLLFLSFFIPLAEPFGPFGFQGNAAVFYGALPLALVLFVFREPLRNFGIAFGGKRKVVFYSIAFSLLLTPAIIIASVIPEINAFYSVAGAPTIGWLAAFELENGAFLFFWELFFRGFVLFGLYRKIGNSALPVHAIPFALFHIGKPSIEVVASFFAALLLGQIALKAKSFLPAFFIHWIIHAEMIALANFS